ncbi:DUF1569 domain-containing protein [Alishewanella sp. d11]|uniref:DUF1569 domain-containing protein n=1 Tax=Alishewanella sp. d11 TaxID=3414030 RepID=UPI003BF7A30C
MNRRQFFKAAAITPIAVMLGTKFIATLRPYPLQALQTQLRGLQPERLVSSGSWNVSQIFQHCAQSIRYSIYGYPEHYSTLFKNTAGKLALNAFAAKGSMHHPLDEVIPGAPELQADVPNDVALRELLFELQQFLHWQGELAPHFAYGSLTKAQYYAAHYLHLENHLLEIRQV